MMDFSVIEFDKEEEYITEFLELPGRLYGKKERMQNVDEERAILLGKHTLSHCFTVHKLLVTDENKKAVGRAVVTLYPEDTTAYLGYYESEDNITICRLLTEQAEKIARQAGCDKIQGPVDTSFWVRYRFKTNHFGQPYTGEPYNKPYYPGLWQQAGFEIAQTYYSNRYRVVGAGDDSEKFSERFQEKKNAGYVIQSPSAKEFYPVMEEVYDMLIELYSSFPVFKHISKEDFIAHYSYLKMLVKYDMVKMAYYQGKPVGFFISIPNYGNLVYGKLSIFDILKILSIRRKPKDYVMLYMGVDFEHKGLGKALAEAIKEELKGKKTPSVGALIRKGNINKDYFKELIEFEYEYVLLEKSL